MSNEITRIVRCDQCKFAEPFIDPFTGKPRLLCGAGIEAVNAIGGYKEGADPNLWGDVTWELMSDRFGGCEFGERKDDVPDKLESGTSNLLGESNE